MPRYSDAGGGAEVDMLPLAVEIESAVMTQAPSWTAPMEMNLQYADILAAVIGVVVLAWIADLITGRRGLFAASLVSAVGAGCGWFLAVRVFGVATMETFGWLVWAAAGSVFCLFAYFLFRNTR